MDESSYLEIINKQGQQIEEGRRRSERLEKELSEVKETLSQERRSRFDEGFLLAELREFVRAAQFVVDEAKKRNFSPLPEES